MSRLTSEEQRFLLRLARQSLSHAVALNPAQPPEEIPATLLEFAGVFVSLRRRGELRGCVGFAEARAPLWRAVMEAAAAAALDDPRFSPVLPQELVELTIEISVLSPRWPVTVDEIQIGVHGLMVSHGRPRGLLLPQVAVEHGWTPQRFVEEVCRKAGLAPDAWRQGAIIEAFYAEVFGEEGKPAAS
jgi:AmmeMemoRadiSam system protein A